VLDINQIEMDNIESTAESLLEEIYSEIRERLKLPSDQEAPIDHNDFLEFLEAHKVKKCDELEK
jgi:hypothetical protein